DRQRRQRAAAALRAHLGGALEQARVQVEDVAGVGLATGRAAQQQRQLAIWRGWRGQGGVDPQRVTAVVTEELAHAAAAVRRDELHGRGVGRARDHDRREVHGAELGELVDHLRDRGLLLADRDVDALHVAGVLVDDRVDGHGRLAGLAVADDQLALAAADRDHRGDRLDARLQRHLHRLAVDDARRLDLDAARGGRLYGTLAV